MNVTLPFTICVATVIVGVFIGRWFRVGMIALATLGLLLIIAITYAMGDLPAWECVLSAIGLSVLLQSGYLAGAFMLDCVPTRVHPSLAGTDLVDL